MKEQIINGKEYRFVELRGRGKWVSKDGDAYNPKKKKRKATKHTNSDGYPCFGGGIPVHLYVAHAWVPGYFEGAEVDHIDYDRGNYFFENLRWVTHKDNIKHSSVDENHYTGLHAGAKNGRATFSAEDIVKIKEWFDKGLSVMDVIKELHPEADSYERKCMWSKYSRIKNKETWSQ